MGLLQGHETTCFKNLMKMGHKWIKEALLRVFITEQMVSPGPHWYLTATHTSVGIKHDSKRDFAT